MSIRHFTTIGLLLCVASCTDGNANSSETGVDCTTDCPPDMTNGGTSATGMNEGGSESGATGGTTMTEMPEAGTSGSSTGGSSGMQPGNDAGSATDDPTAGSNDSGGGASGSGASAGTSTGGTAGDTADGPSSSRLTAVPIGTTDAELGFWEYLPPGYGNEPVPLLVFTHGAAWQGEGTLETLQEVLDVGPPNLISTDAWPNDRPFLVLAPQNPRAGCFDPEDIDGFYDYALDTYNIDTKRVYHTGQSCGAIGAWNYLAGHLDEVVTAAVLIAGDGRDAFEQAGCDLGRVAIWGLHNEMDSSVSSQGTIVPIEGLLECDPTPDVKLTLYPGETAHDAWTKTYDLSAGNDIYSWLLEHVHP